MSRRSLLIDLAICVALLAAAVPVTLQPDAPEGAGAGTPWDTVLLPAAVLPLLLRGRSPFIAAAALAAGCVVSGIPTFDQYRLGAAIPAAMLIAFSLGRRERRRRAAAGLLLLLGAMLFVGATDAVLSGAGGAAGMVLFSFPLSAGMWFVGRLARSRDELTEVLAQRTRRLERRREQTAELAVEVERARLATDVDAAARVRLHEIVALADGAGGDARLAFSAIERLGRESLNEMRGLLGVLRSDERGPRAPRPTLDELDALLAEARRGGRSVQLEVQGERRPLSAGVELAAYRTLQHALLTVRGETSEPASVLLRYLPAELEVEVRGPSAGGGIAAAALAAARERVTAHGGSFRTETAGDRRLLHAQLPAGAAGG